MRKLLVTMAVLASALFSAKAEEITKTFYFGDIKSLDIEYCYMVHVTKGNSNAVKVEYDSVIRDYMDIQYDSNTCCLEMKMDKKTPKTLFKTGRLPRINIYLEMDDIKKLDINGAASVTFEGEYKGNGVDIELSGASKIKSLNIKGESLSFTCSGASNGTIEGDFSGDVDITLSGASRMSCTCNCKEIDAQISGASRLTLEGNYNDVDVACSGASSAQMEGSAKTAEFECSGASRIEAKDFITKDLRADLSGASWAEVHATSNLVYSISRACKIIYHGDAFLKNLTAEPNVIKGR